MGTNDNNVEVTQIIGHKLMWDIPPEYQKCCVCKGETWRTEAKALHPIPNHDAVVQMRWFSFIRRARGPDWTPKDDNNIPLVCSLHFTSRSYQPSSLRLKPNVVPFLDVKQPGKRKRRQELETGSGKGGCKTEKSRVVVNPRNIPVIQPQRPSSVVERPPIAMEQAPAFNLISSPDFSEFTDSNKASGVLFGIDSGVTLGEAGAESLNFSTDTDPFNMNLPNADSSSLQLITLPSNVASGGGTETDESKNRVEIKKSRQRRRLNRFHSVSVVLPKSNAPDNQFDLNQKQLFFFPGVTYSSRGSINSELLQNISSVDQIESPVFSLLGVEQFQSNSEVKSGRSEVPKDINFCLICGNTLHSAPEINTLDALKSREILFNLLNFRVGDSEISDNYPVCCQCIRKVLNLQQCLDALLAKQREMEQQRNNLLEDIVRTFCMRSHKNIGTSFATSKALHAYITQKWASNLRPPYEQFKSDWNNDVDLVQNIIAERKQKRKESRRKNSQRKRLPRASEIEKTELKVVGKPEESNHLEPETQERKLKMETSRRSRCRERTQCPVCLLELQKLSLRKHMLIHDSDPRYSCSLCCKSFLRLDALRNHELTHKIGEVSFGQTDRGFKCPYCHQIVTGGKRYFQHVTMNHLSSSESQVDCRIFYDCDAEDCNLSYSKIEDFHQHLWSHSENPLKCSNCGKLFARPENLVIHEEVHTASDNLYDCAHCYRFFKTDLELKKHQFLHQISVDPKALKFICELCGAKFITRSQLFSHRSYHSRSKVRLGGEIRKYQLCICEVCGAEFNSETRVKMHAYEHTHPEGFPCNQCQRIFPNPTKLWFHQKRNTNCSSESNNGLKSIRSKRQRFSKLKNNLKLKSAVALKANKKDSLKPKIKKPITTTTAAASSKSDTVSDVKGNTKNIYPCKHCDVTLKNLYIHRRHNLLFHPEIYVDGKTFICPVCWKNFPVQEQLDEHCLSQHDRSKCKVCNKLFPSLAKLKQHTRTHTGEKPFKCQFCGKCFNLETNVKEHELRHTGNRPHRCCHCGSGFFRKKQLQQHVEKIHPQEIPVQTIPSGDSPSLEINTGSQSHPVLEGRVDNPVIVEPQQTQNHVIDFSNFVVNF